jgi:hypothetical protein
MLRGGKSDVVVALCLGAIAIRLAAPNAQAWISATAPLRSPCATRQYGEAHGLSAQRIKAIRRLARALASSRKLTSAHALWILGEAPERRAA